MGQGERWRTDLSVTCGDVNLHKRILSVVSFVKLTQVFPGTDVAQSIASRVLIVMHGGLFHNGGEELDALSVAGSVA